MSQKDDIQKLILEHNRRLQLLKEKKARLGISADVSLDVEIEDIENEIKKLKTALKDLERVEKPALRITSPIPKSANNNLQRTISDKQKEILAFIESFVEENNLSPTLEEIRRGLKISTKSLVDYNLKVLAKAGFLTRLPNMSRGTCLASKDEISVKVPLGRITAGKPIWVPKIIQAFESDFGNDYTGFDDSEDYDDYITISLPHKLAKEKKNIYTLKVWGDSMIDALINNGDIVVMFHTSAADNGDMIAAWLVDDEETTLKRIFYENGLVRLQPENPKYEPSYYAPDKVRVLGKVVRVVRSYAN